MEAKCVDLTIENRALVKEKALLQEENTVLKLKVEQLEAEIRHAHQDQQPSHPRRDYDPYENI